MEERISKATLKCVKCESPLQVDFSVFHLRCAYCGIVQKVIQVGETLHLARFSEADQANAEKQVRRLLKDVEQSTLLQQSRRESAASRLFRIEREYRIGFFLYGLMWIDGIVLLLVFVTGKLLLSMTLNLLGYVYISIGIGMVLGIWFFYEKRKRKKAILAEMTQELSQIEIHVRATQAELQSNQRIVDSKNF